MARILNNAVLSLLIMACLVFAMTPVRSDTYAFLVSVGQFQDNTLPTLPGAANDMALWEDMLRNQYGVPATNIVKLQDEQATFENIKLCLKGDASHPHPLIGDANIIGRIKAGDTLFIAISSHGTHLSNNFDFHDIEADPHRKKRIELRGALALYKTKQGDANSYFIDLQLKALIAPAKSTRIVILVDSCEADETAKVFEITKVKGTIQSPWLDLANLHNLGEEKGRAIEGPVVIIASRRHESVREVGISDFWCSPCTLLLWLRTTALSEPITYGELAAMLKKGYTQLSQSTLPEVGLPNVATNLVKKEELMWRKIIPSKNNNVTLKRKVNPSTIVDYQKPRREIAYNLSLNGVQIGSSKGKRRVAIVMGINEWGENSGLSKLKGAENDANDLANVLETSGYTVILMTPSSPPGLRPIKTNIIQVLEDELKKEDVESLVIYVSMHGVTDGESGESFLMPLDGLRSQAALTGLSLRNLAKIVHDNAPKITHILFLIDACQLGADIIQKEIQKVSGVGNTQWTVMSATREGVPAWEREGDPKSPIPELRKSHGLFTSFLLESLYGSIVRTEKDSVVQQDSVLALGDSNSDGMITFDEAFNFASGRMRQWQKSSNAKGENRPAEPSVANLNIASGLKLGSSRRILGFDPAVAIRKDQIISPRLVDGKLMVYENMKEDTESPFDFSGWMWGNNLKKQQHLPQDAKKIMDVNLFYHDVPDRKDETSIEWNGRWFGNSEGKDWSLTWLGLGAIYKQDEAPWWAEEGYNRGLYYDFQTRPARKFRFRARSGINGKIQRIQVKIGYLARDSEGHRLRMGDSVSWPISSQWFELSDAWQMFEFDVKPLPQESTSGDQNDLSRICSFAFIVERRQQPDGPDRDKPFRILLDDIYFDFNN